MSEKRISFTPSNLLAFLILLACAGAWWQAWELKKEIRLSNELAVESHRLMRERTVLFSQWANTFERIERRQMIYLEAQKKVFARESWERIEEINRGL